MFQHSLNYTNCYVTSTKYCLCVSSILNNSRKLNLTAILFFIFLWRKKLNITIIFVFVRLKLKFAKLQLIPIPKNEQVFFMLCIFLSYRVPTILHNFKSLFLLVVYLIIRTHISLWLCYTSFQRGKKLQRSHASIYFNLTNRSPTFFSSHKLI